MPVTGEKIALDAAAVRLAFGDLRAVEHLEPFDPVCVAARQRSSSRPSSDSSVATISLPTLRYSIPFASQYSQASLRPSTHSLALSDPGL